MELIIISGRSGAGKSVALKALEDLGFYCVDNLPLALLGSLLEHLHNCPQVVVSIDVRNLTDAQSQAWHKDIPHNIHSRFIFLDCKAETLVKRYSDTRRIHPLSNQDVSLETAIEVEQHKLRSLLPLADYIIDTTKLSTHQLAEQLRLIVQGNSTMPVQIMIESFGFKYGLPLSADFVFDARFLPNPHWIEGLREQTGLDLDVQNYLHDQPLVKDFIEHTLGYIQRYLPSLKANNRSYITISIGCTGGKHRSVYVAEQIYHALSHSQEHLSINHRQLDYHKNSMRNFYEDYSNNR